jgi:organic radical activating enzyme
MMYPVADIFWSLQGEGHFVGAPMTFVRLAGCSVLGCSIRAECDEAPWKAQWSMRTLDIVDRVKTIRASGIVCITGGEPTDHDLIPLVCALHESGYRVHIETSGVRPVMGIPIEWLTVSPKSGDYRQRVGHTLKIVVRPEWKDPWCVIKSLDTGADFFHRYLQPLTVNGAPVNLQQVKDLLDDMHNGGGRWFLSTQAHRTWGMK